MTFDPISLLQAPLAPSPEILTVDTLAARLAQLSAMGFGNADVELAGRKSITTVELLARDAGQAYFALLSKTQDSK